MNDVLPEFWDDLKTIPVFVTHVRTSERLRSVLAAAQQGTGNLGLVAEVCTRWGSRYDMLHRFLQLKDAVIAVAACVNREEASDDIKVRCAASISLLYLCFSFLKKFSFLAFSLSLQTFLDNVDQDDFWLAVKAMVKALGPVKQVTETLGGENFISVSIVCSAIVTLTGKLAKGSDISKRLAGAVKLRFSPWFRPGIATAAALLDPQTTALASYFPATVSVDDKEMTVNDIIEASWERLRKDALYFSADLIATSFQRMPAELFALTVNAAIDSLREVSDATLFFSLIFSLFLTPCGVYSLQIMEEIATKDVKQRPTAKQFWSTEGKQHFNGVLLPLARAYLCIPATEVPSERVWSSAGFIYNETNAQMTNENICKRVRVRDRALELKSPQDVRTFVDDVKKNMEGVERVVVE